jgi:nucleotide-binding universal stress UspA family protein
MPSHLIVAEDLRCDMSPPTPPPAPGAHRPTRGRSDQAQQTGRSSAPKLIGVAVDGHASGRDAVTLSSLLARALGAELMLIAIHEEPVLPIALPGAMSWKTIEEQTRAMLAKTRDSLAPEARIMVQADTLVWRGLCHVVQHEHRDLLVVGSAQDADAGSVRLGKRADELLGHLECPLAVAPSGFRERAEQRLDRIGVGFDDSPESWAALDLAASIASSTGAALEVREAIDDGVAGGLRTEQVLPEGDAITERQLASAYERGLAAISGLGVSANLEVEVGMPTDVLASMCEEVDLLVFGSGHSAPAGRVQPGKTGRALLRLARCAVLLAPRPAAPRQSG